jgi:hypothetical protein
MLHDAGFRGWLLRHDGAITDIIDPIYQKQIDLIHEHIKAKAIELGLTLPDVAHNSEKDKDDN